MKPVFFSIRERSFFLRASISVQVQERLEDPPAPVEPVCSSVCDIVDEVCHAYRASANPHARELVYLLGSSHLRALLETHDAVVERRRRTPAVPSPPSPSTTMPTNERTEAVRVVGLRRQPDEPLVSNSAALCVLG